MGNCESDSRNPNAFSPPSNTGSHSYGPQPFPTVHGTFPSGTKSRDVDVVNVIVPAGVQAGQSINVVAPDGRIVSAVVPNGMGAGSQFMVRFPPSYAPSAPVEAPAEAFKPDYAAVATPTGSTAAYPMAAATLINEAQEPPPFSLALDLPPPTYNPNSNAVSPIGTPQQPEPYHLQQQQQSTSVPPGQKLVRVQVPPGVAPGTMISVQIPDEPSRIVTAQVPPNATEFNVAYYPSTIPTVAATSSSYNYNNINAYQGPPPPSMPPIPAYNSFPPQSKYNKFNNNNGYNNNNNNNRPGIGGYILPVLGGAAIGAAAMELFDGDDWGDW